MRGKQGDWRSPPWGQTGRRTARSGSSENVTAPSQIALMRWRAASEARRRKLEQDLTPPLDDATREKVSLLLRNIEGREAWQAARLDHLVQMKVLLTRALAHDATPPPSLASPVRGARRLRRATASSHGGT
jgi:hypothetical protein